MRFDGQQRVMRLSGAPLGSPAAKRVLTNRMREIFTYGSLGGAEGNLGPYPAPNCRQAPRLRCARFFGRCIPWQRPSPAAVGEFDRWTALDTRKEMHELRD